MKINSLLYFSILCTFIGLLACKNQSARDMKDFAKEEEFKNEHELPRKATLSDKGQWREIELESGESFKVFEMKPENETEKALLVFHEWWGLNENIMQEVQKYADSLAPCHVIAVDLYGGNVADNRDDASKYMQAVDDEKAKEKIRKLISTLPSNAQIATVGWCFGGGWSLKAGIEAGEQGVGSVIYYGMPVETAAELAPLSAPVLGIFADKDGWINHDVVNAFNKLCKATKKDFTYEFYDAAHAFANPSSDRYNEEAATSANAKVLLFLRDCFE